MAYHILDCSTGASGPGARMFPAVHGVHAARRNGMPLPRSSRLRRCHTLQRRAQKARPPRPAPRPRRLRHCQTQLSRRRRPPSLPPPLLSVPPALFLAAHARSLVSSSPSRARRRRRRHRRRKMSDMTLSHRPRACTVSIYPTTRALHLLNCGAVRIYTGAISTRPARRPGAKPQAT